MALDFALSEDQLAVRSAAEQLIKRFAPRRAEFRKMIFQQQRFPGEIWDGLAEAGFLGAVIPEEYGGTAMGLLPVAFAVETLGREGLAGALLILTVMDSACIVKNGTPELKRRVLPKIAKGELKLCFALTEAEAGTNTFRMKTAARKAKDGSHYVVSGEKTFITGADAADRMLLVTRTLPYEEAKAQGFPKTWGFSLFLLDPKARGVSLTKLNTRGIEGYEQWTVHLDDVEISATDLVGEQDAGIAALFNSLNPERILASALVCGIADHLVARSVEYATQRKVFRDTPIGAYQAVAHPLARLAIRTEAVRHLAYRAAWAFDRDLPSDETAFWANAAKLEASELGVAAADAAIQTHGGAGFDEDVGVIQYWSSMRLLKTAPINNEMILNFVAEHRLGLPRSY